jgi:two-component system nitrogen regulation response regulator GlnG
MPSVLTIDDDPLIHHRLRRDFEGTDISLLFAETGEQGLAAVANHQPDVVILDVMLPDLSGLDTFRRIHAADPHIPVIFITTNDESTTAIEAMTLGAYDYLLKPLDRRQVQELVGRAIEIRRLMLTPVELATRSKTPSQAGDVLVGRCPAMQEVYKAIGRVAGQDLTVLIHGESGTGKELVARAIYQHSRRATRQFLTINCAAIPETLLESELFGHEKGAFTGADRRRIGKFEQCTGGTLFLDEIGDMTPATQSKVLRVLQEQTFERLGGTDTVTTDVRIIVATNVDLEQAVSEGRFRADLYYRLNVFTIDLPPLRERLGDLPLLLDHLLVRISQELDKPVRGISPEALDMLLQYAWPGNVRELQSVLKQALLASVGNVLLPDFLPQLTPPDSSKQAPTHAKCTGTDWQSFVHDGIARDSRNLHAEALEKVERELLTLVLAETSGNQLRAAQILGITRGTLRNKIRSLGIAIDRVIGSRSSVDRDTPSTNVENADDD